MISENEFLKALIVFFVIAVVFSLIPFFIAQSRQAIHRVPIFWLSLIMGWTVVGWIAAFIWASVDKVEEPKDSGTDIEGKSASGIDVKVSKVDEEKLEKQISEAIGRGDYATVQQLVGKRR